VQHLSLLMVVALAVPLTATVPRGYEVRGAAVQQTPAGARIHGRICRQSLTPPPTRLAAEHLDADGKVLASASHSLSGLGGRGNACAVFDFPTDWTLAAGDAVKLCALRSNGACPTP
jgi:hypothetical protein